MSISQAYLSSTEAMFTDMAQRPQQPRPQEPMFSAWGLAIAAPRGAAAGAAQAVGSGADVSVAFGDVLGALGDAGSQGMFGGLTEQERKESNAAREKLLTSGVDFNSEAGRIFRNVGKDYMPDPTTAHAAEQAVANLFRVGIKAVGAGAVAGPVGGAIIAGAEEGFTTADDLGQQGVDLATRTKAGAVAAAVNAVGFALPVAGQTWKSTAGLAVAGGPASFVAQNAATREILQSAGYDKISEQYDPFDPVGLTLSTLLPLGFGAFAMRGKAAAKAAKVDDDAVDAARVNLLREGVDNARLTDASDFAGAAAHDAAMAKAIDVAARGERVEVSDVAPMGIEAKIADQLMPRLKEALDEMGPLPKFETPAIKGIADGVLEGWKPPEDAAAPASKAKPAKEAPGAKKDEGTAAPAKLASEAPEVERTVLAIEQQRPDLMVKLDDDSVPEKLSDLMARIREELGADVGEAPLVEAAAACFLATGQ